MEVDTSREATRKIRSSIPRAWRVFFSRFGKLTPIQALAIPRVLAGASLVVASPTASGKTEALIAPVAEMLAARRQEGLQAVIVSPTRALVNDMRARLEDPLKDIYITTGVRTGDRAQFNRTMPEHLLITTPESLDSLVCRHPNVFADLQVVIIDELHLLDGTYRGDQLRILVRRLEELSASTIQCLALSATMRTPIEMASRYFSNPELVKVSGQRELDHTVVASIEEAFSQIERKKFRKSILFANSRKRVEEITHQAREWFAPELVAIHHGSLSRSVRESTEAFMRGSPYGHCVATMTLEIGVDIGGVDVVVLADPPTSVSAFLQRIGRGNRRTARTVAISVCQNETERMITKQLVESAARGVVESRVYIPDHSVVVQQLFSLLFASPSGLSETRLRTYFVDFCDSHVLGEVVDHLVETEMIIRRYDRLFASGDVMDLGEQGRVHSNIPRQFSQRVRNVHTGEVIGEIADMVDPVFAFAGRSWTVIGQTKGTIEVKPGMSGSPSASFPRVSSVGSFRRYLPPQLQH